MAKLGEAFVVIRASLAPLRKGLATARKAVSAAMRKISSVMHKMGRLIKRAMLIGVVAIGYAIKAAADFQKQLAMVSTMLSDEAMPMMDKYKDTIKALAKEFGQSTKTLTKGLYDILSASIAVEKATDVLRAASKAAIAGMTETEVAADAITTIINSYAMDAERASEISDKLFATVKRGKLTFNELASSIGRAAAIASIGGMKLEELLATIATVTRAGIRSEEAMTSIVGVMRTFLKPTDDAIEAAKEFGLTLSSATLKEKGFIGAAKLLTKASADQLAKIVPNIRGFKAFAAALKDVTGLTYDLNFITNRFTGEADKAYQKMSATVRFRLGQLKQQFIATFRFLGEPLLEPFLRLSDKVSETLESMEIWFGENKKAIEEWGNVAIDYFEDLLAIVKDKGWETALSRLGADIKKALKITIEYIKPYAFEIGRIMAAGFWNAIKTGAVAAGKRLDVGRKGAYWTPAKKTMMEAMPAAGVGGSILLAREIALLIRAITDLRETQERTARIGQTVE